MKHRFIPVCEPLLAGNELKYVTEAVRTGWISSAGSYLHQFEEAFAKFCDVKHATSVSNGTNAIHLALKAIDIRPGDEVIMPDFTMIGSAFPICYLGAKPVFVDADPETWNMNPKLIEEKITERTRVVMAVHIYGHPCDMEPIWALAKKHDLRVVEDAAEVHGAEYFGKKCGNLGDIAAFSFFANKVVTTGEGGMVLTNSSLLIERSRYYKDLCFPLTGGRTYCHDDIGFQYRLSNVQAAIGLAQVEKIEEYIERRRNINSLYSRYLRDVDGITLQPERDGCKNVYWMNGAVVDRESFPMSRDTLIERLQAEGIQTRKFFVPMHRQPALQKYGCDSGEDYPVSSYLSENGLYFPSGSGLRLEEIEYICEKVRLIAGSA